MEKKKRKKIKLEQRFPQTAIGWDRYIDGHLAEYTKHTGRYCKTCLTEMVVYFYAEEETNLLICPNMGNICSSKPALLSVKDIIGEAAGEAYLRFVKELEQKEREEKEKVTQAFKDQVQDTIEAQKNRPSTEIQSFIMDPWEMGYIAHC